MAHSINTLKFFKQVGNGGHQPGKRLCLLECCETSQSGFVVEERLNVRGFWIQ